MDVSFEGEVWHWRGPAPHHFITIPDDQASAIASVAAAVTYGWGVVPVSGRIGATQFTTSLFPKDGGYLLPLKKSVRQAEHVELGDRVAVQLTIEV